MEKANSQTDSSMLHKEFAELTAKVDEAIKLLKKLNAGNSRKKHFSDIINDNRKRR